MLCCSENPIALRSWAARFAPLPAMAFTPVHKCGALGCNEHSGRVGLTTRTDRHGMDCSFFATRGLNAALRGNLDRNAGFVQSLKVSRADVFHDNLVRPRRKRESLLDRGGAGSGFSQLPARCVVPYLQLVNLRTGFPSRSVHQNLPSAG